MHYVCYFFANHTWWVVRSSPYCGSALFFTNEYSLICWRGHQRSQVLRLSQLSIHFPTARTSS